MATSGSQGTAILINTRFQVQVRSGSPPKGSCGRAGRLRTRSIGAPTLDSGDASNGDSHTHSINVLYTLQNPLDTGSGPGEGGGPCWGGLPRYTLAPGWGCSSAGRALQSHCRGRGFESHHLHQSTDLMFTRPFSTVSVSI
jgi:hypothetical protein